MSVVGCALRPAQWRGAIAVLMMLVIGAVSFVIIVHRPALASPAYSGAIAQLTDSRISPAKPCHKIVLPGAANTCPLLSFCFGAILGADANCAIPQPAAMAAWRLGDSSLPMQYAGLGLFRPPRPRV